jgi:CelD/BcsL family acetyltransferase involved in cellulose biosynthesis
MTDYFGLIAEPDLRIDAVQLLRLAGLNHLYFTHLDESQLSHGLPGERPEVGLRLKLDPSVDYWSHELKSGNPKLVSETGRVERLLQRQYGSLCFTFAETEPYAPLRNLIRYKGLQYERTGAGNSLEEPWRARLLETLAGSDQAGCKGVLSTLYAGKTWVASHFGLRSGETLHYWFPVYNPDLRKFAPGRLLLKSIIQHASTAGIALIDRGAGDTHAKRQLTNQEHLFYRGAWYRHGVRSMAMRVHLSLKWRVEGLSKATENGGIE